MNKSLLARVGEVKLSRRPQIPPTRFNAGEQGTISEREFVERIGQTGWNRTGRGDTGIITEDPNPMMKPYQTRGLKAQHGIYKQMRKTDGNVAGVSVASELPILSAEQRINVEQDATDEELAIRDFLWYCWERCKPSAFIGKAVRHEQYGFRAFEMIFEQAETPWGLKWVPLPPEDRLPWSVKNWVFDGDTPVGFEQVGGQIIPSWKYMLFTNRGADDGPEGESVYRPGWSYWDEKLELVTILRQITQKWSVGILHVEQMIEGLNDGDLDTLAEVLRDWMSALNAFVIMPYGTKFNLDFPIQNLPDLTWRFRWLDQQVLVSLVALWMLHGSTDTGTRNVTKEHIEFFRSNRVYTAKTMSEVITYGGEYGAGLFDTCVRLNFTTSPGFRLPWHAFDGIDAMSMKEQAEILRIIEPLIGPINREVQEQVRETFGVAALPAEEIEEKTDAIPGETRSEDPGSVAV